MDHGVTHDDVDLLIGRILLEINPFRRDDQPTIHKQKLVGLVAKGVPNRIWDAAANLGAANIDLAPFGQVGKMARIDDSNVVLVAVSPFVRALDAAEGKNTNGERAGIGFHYISLAPSHAGLLVSRGLTAYETCLSPGTMPGRGALILLQLFSGAMMRSRHEDTTSA